MDDLYTQGLQGQCSTPYNAAIAQYSCSHSESHNYNSPSLKTPENCGKKLHKLRHKFSYKCKFACETCASYKNPEERYPILKFLYILHVKLVTSYTIYKPRNTQNDKSLSKFFCTGISETRRHTGHQKITAQIVNKPEEFTRDCLKICR